MPLVLWPGFLRSCEYLTRVGIGTEYFLEKPIRPDFVLPTHGAVPPVYHVKFDAYLIPDSPRSSLRIEDLTKIVSRIEFPVRSDGISVEIQNSAEVV
jgi:hypothetical protein